MIKEIENKNNKKFLFIFFIKNPIKIIKLIDNAKSTKFLS